MLANNPNNDKTSFNLIEPIYDEKNKIFGPFGFIFQLDKTSILANIRVWNKIKFMTSSI